MHNVTLSLSALFGTVMQIREHEVRDRRESTTADPLPLFGQIRINPNLVNPRFAQFEHYICLASYFLHLHLPLPLVFQLPHGLTLPLKAQHLVHLLPNSAYGDG